MGLIDKIKNLLGNKESKEKIPKKTTYLLEETNNIDDFIINSKGKSYIPIPEEFYDDEFLVQQWNYSISAIKIAKECNLYVSGDYQITPGLIFRNIN